METSDFILEIGLEEVPARFLDGLLKEMASKASELLSGRRLGYSKIRTVGTMRRLVLSVKGLETKQSDIETEVRGPSKKAAFTAEGVPTKAAEGFAASQKIVVKDLTTKEVQGGEYVFALRKEKGRPAEQVLKDFIPELLSALYLPVSMKWGDASFEFIRPIHYITAVFGDREVKTPAGGVKTSGKTFVRLPSGDAEPLVLEKADISKYEKVLGGHGVVLDGEKRKAMIKDQILAFERASSEKVLSDDELLTETANLVEGPKVLHAQFDPQFIIVLPMDVISTVVKKQQKCFPVEGSGSFLIISDGKSEKAIIKGYEQVVNARLSDAKFFYDEDIKAPFESNLEKMKKITYHEKIGSMWDKTQRVVALSAKIAEELSLPKEAAQRIQRAAELCKADLATHMVGEFSGLAGIMGREYSLVAGEDVRVANAIFEHYLPRSSDDVLPAQIEGAVVGISDRLDSIVNCFRSGIIPSGSNDPYALRRAAAGIVSIILHKALPLSLKGLIKSSAEISGPVDPSVIEAVENFILQRFKVLLEGEGLRYDMADAILPSADMLPQAYCRAFILKERIDDADIKGIIASADRIGRIVKDGSQVPVKPDLFDDPSEKDLFKTLCQVKDIYEERMKAQNYSAALDSLCPLTPVIGTFFEKTLVMHQDPKIRENRLALLESIGRLYKGFADLSKIVS